MVRVSRFIVVIKLWSDHHNNLVTICHVLYVQIFFLWCEVYIKYQVTLLYSVIYQFYFNKVNSVLEIYYEDKVADVHIWKCQTTKGW